VAKAMVGASSIAPMVLPHALQKALLEYEEERQVDGLPAGPIHSTACAATSTQDRVRDPECLRQVAHEHVCGLASLPVTRNRMAPHRQPPSYGFGFMGSEVKKL
jgi:hypothetical protein